MVVRYNEALLAAISQKHGIQLTYEGKLMRDTRLSGVCITDGCDEAFDRDFRSLYNSGNERLHCDVHATEAQVIQTRNMLRLNGNNVYDQVTLEGIMAEHNVALTYEGSRLTRETIIAGVCKRRL